jgi:AraC-like DNA-binding protein
VTQPPPVVPRPVDARWREWMSLRTNLVWIYEGAVQRANQRGPFSADHLAAWLVLAGSVELRAEGRSHRACAGEWMIPWPGQRWQEFSDDARILSVRFQWEWPDGRPLFERGLPVVVPAAEHPGLEAAARALLDVTGPLRPADPVALPNVALGFAAFALVKARFLEWLVAFHDVLARVDVRPSRLGIADERVAAAVQRLDTCALSERILEEDLAHEVGLGLSQFVRVFREELGVTPKRYFDERRRLFCRRMLKNTAVPIKQIAFDLGFRRLSDFSAWFKDAHAVSPRQFRQRKVGGFAV